MSDVNSNTRTLPGTFYNHSPINKAPNIRLGGENKLKLRAMKNVKPITIMQTPTHETDNESQPKIAPKKSKPQIQIESESDVLQVKYDSLPSLTLPSVTNKVKTPTVASKKPKVHKSNKQNIKMLKKLNEKRKGKKPPLA